jgi:hypothetical protein
MLPRIMHDTKYIEAAKPSFAMKIYIVEFQFSPVIRTNTVIKDYPNVLKWNLVGAA